MRFPARPSVLAAATLALLVPALVACGAGSVGLPAQEALDRAKQTLDATSGVRFSIVTDDLPEDVLAMRSATGVLTREPAFEGSITAPFRGLEVELQVVAVDGEVFVRYPLTTSYDTIDPADYGIPDPATLLDPELGISSLLAETTEPEKGGSVRGGADNRTILTEYSGTVAGEAMADVLPLSEGDFDATYTIDDDGRLSEAVLTGHFNGADHPSNTYTVTVDEYDVEQEISAP